MLPRQTAGVGRDPRSGQARPSDDGDSNQTGVTVAPRAFRRVPGKQPLVCERPAPQALAGVRALARCRLPERAKARTPWQATGGRVETEGQGTAPRDRPVSTRDYPDR